MIWWLNWWFAIHFWSLEHGCFAMQSTTPSWVETDTNSYPNSYTSLTIITFNTHNPNRNRPFKICSLSLQYSRLFQNISIDEQLLHKGKWARFGIKFFSLCDSSYPFNTEIYTRNNVGVQRVPKTQDWNYLQYLPDTNPKYQSLTKHCVQCHNMECTTPQSWWQWDTCDHHQ